MAANVGKLAGQTVFITGASRGIGRALAIKVARDGANVVLASKTGEPHPKLPGTIYTVAEEVTKAGGNALPCVMDVRSEQEVVSAVKQTVAEFGGIDILVNNASAISLTGTLQTPMKKYDLMNSINARGTYLCSQACLPYLMKSKNPHILVNSPPLKMSPKWFKSHVAYTIAKSGMSMCVLGMAEEFRDEGVAVNAFWPRTAIWSAAVKMLGGGTEELMEQCRTPEIMSDAGYVILTRNSREFTGNFCIDEDVLRSVGVTDFEQYACVPGGKLLYLDKSPGELNASISPSHSQGSTKTNSIKITSVAQWFSMLKEKVVEKNMKDVGISFQFELSGEEAGTWHIDLKSDSPSASSGALDNPDCTLAMDSALFLSILSGKATPVSAYMSGKLKLQGDMGAAMKLDKLMKSMN